MSLQPAEPAAAPGAQAPGAAAAAEAPTRPAQLTVSGLSKAYGPGQADVLRDAGFVLRQGECLAVIGANGSGKSTMLRCCLRLIEPDAGDIRLLDQDVRAARERSLRRLRAQVGFVFQRHNLVPRLSVLSNVLHGAQARAASPRNWFQATAPRHLREEALTCLERVGLADFAGRRSDRLSGGQSQRVAIARTLMQRPRLVFADEPAASLDPTAGEEVMGLFAQLMRDERVGVLFTCHDLEHARRYADRVLALKGGRVSFDRAVDEIDFDGLRHLYDPAPRPDTARQEAPHG
jgi:phosphonate transport system ATP-binding protein